MALIPEHTVEQVLGATDLVSLIGDRVALRRVGSRYRGLCPFHHEKTPSFYVDPARQRYHCFGCGADGSAAGWLMAFENRSFPEAIELLAKQANIPLAEIEESPVERQARAGRDAALAALSASARHFAELLWNDPQAAHARQYLQARGLDRATAEAWQFGWAPASSQSYLDWARQRSLSGRALVNAGLASPREEDNPRAGLYARFRDRLMFPIEDGNGRIVGFSGRILDPQSKLAKYVNTPETNLFRKGSLLFGLHRARRPIIAAHRALLCEGQLDTIALQQAGFAEALAPLGTALTPEHASALARIAETVILVFDGDAAGAKATERAAEILIRTGLRVRVAPLPQGEDPDSLLRQHGPESMQARIDSAQDFFDYLYESQATRYDLSNPDQRQNFAARMIEALRLIADSAAREAHILRLAGRLGIADQEIRQRVAQAIAQERRANTPRQSSSARSSETAPQAKTSAPAFQPPTDPLWIHLSLLLLLPESRDVLLQAAPATALAEFPGTELARRLLALEFDPQQPASLNRALGELEPTAAAWLNGQLEVSPLRRADGPALQTIAQETLARLENRRLRQQLQVRTAQLKAGELDADGMLQLQREMVEIRNHLAKLQSDRFLK